jgi:hypothetical protein
MTKGSEPVFQRIGLHRDVGGGGGGGFCHHRRIDRRHGGDGDGGRSGGDHHCRCHAGRVADLATAADGDVVVIVATVASTVVIMGIEKLGLDKETGRKCG